MFATNLKFIIRRLLNQKTHTFLHVFGLTLGITTCLIIGLFLAYELSFDQYHSKADRIYRVNQVWETPNAGFEYKYTAPAPLAAALRENIPSMETVASVFPREETTIEVNPNKLFNEDRILFAEADILNVFDFEIIEGDAYEALRKPWQAVLTESTAEKFFGGEDPIGKTLIYDGDKTITVGAVIKDLPDNFHLPASMLISYLIDREYMGFNMSGWGFTFGASTYAVLKEGIEPTTLNESIQLILDKYANADPDDLERSSVDLQPLTNIHLETKYDGGGVWVKAVHPQWLWFFGLIGLLVLGLACVNFINLSTAQAILRSKEVAVRKAIGANRRQLISQFIGEAVMIVLIATSLALLIANFTLPLINDKLGKALSFSYLISGANLLSLVVVLAFTVSLTGLYPAWVLSKFQPAISLKGKSGTGDKGSVFLRKALVTAQFTVSGALLIALFFISQQLNLFYTQGLGFDKDNILMLKAPNEAQYGVLTRELNQINEVKRFSFMSGPPSQLSHYNTDMQHYGDPSPYAVKLVFGDNHYPELFDLPLIAGRYFSIRDTSASSYALPRDQRFPKVLVNQALIKVMNFGSPEEAIGKRFKLGWNGWQPEIVGVVEDFTTNSLHEPVQSTVIFQQKGTYGYAGVKIAANSNVPKTLASIQAAWKTAFPKHAYDYEFLDDRIKGFYETESQLLGLFKVFAGLAILISCLGLWGLATHAAVQRMREIGIRKVLGASVFGIVKMISKDFLTLVGLSVLLAIPFAWYFTQKWLDNFTNRIEIEWWVFALSGAVVLLIAITTVSIQSIKAALTNPVDCIRQG